MNKTYRVHCPECDSGKSVDSPFIAHQLSTHHNLEYGHNADWESVETEEAR